MGVGWGKKLKLPFNEADMLTYSGICVNFVDINPLTPIASLKTTNNGYRDEIQEIQSRGN